MKVIKFLAVLLTLLVIAAIPSTAAPLVGPCAAGAAYDPACDVNHDGNIDIYDIQLTAGHWAQTGTYNIYPAMVPKTGQTACYDYNTPGGVVPCPGLPSYLAGQDGDWQKGVAWPNPRFIDNSNGTVTDKLTGLIWLKNAGCFGTRAWTGALYAANSLNNGECGLTDGSAEGDWRLPNVREMQSLVDYGQFDPALPSGHPFTNVANTYYWASTTVAIDAYYAMVVSLHYGRVFDYNKPTPQYVWPVRGGQ